MVRPVRNYLASLTLAAAGLLGACTSGTSTPPVNPPGPDPNPDCLEETVTATSDAANLGLDIDVSIFDTNENRASQDSEPVECYTTDEQDMVEELAALRSEGAPRVALERIIADHPVVGPGIVQALRMDWEATKRDQQHDPSIEFYDRGRIGWIPLDVIIGGSLPGRKLESLGGSSPHPFDDVLWDVGLPDRDPEPDSFQSFLRERGLTCLDYGGGEDYPTVARTQSTGDFLYDVEGFPPLPVRNGTLDGGVIEGVYVFERPDPIIGEYSDSNILVRYDIHPDDAAMLGFESGSYYVLYAHVTPTPDEQLFSLEDYAEAGIIEGAQLDTADLIGYVNYFHARTMKPILDVTVFVRDDLGFGPPFNPGSIFGDVQTLDVFDASRYPRKIAPTPTEPRYEKPEDIFGCS